MSLATPDSIRKLQRKLCLKAKDEPAFRFYLLYDKICREDILCHAYHLARANKGAPGVDGVTFAMIEASGMKEWLAAIRKDLVVKTYRPAPVRRVMIPKPGGGERPLGIPTIRDRVVQTAAKLVLEPIFEADLDPAAYGYRPERNGTDAIRDVHALLCRGYTEVVDADLSKYFDGIPHHDLMRSVARRIVDRHVLQLIKLWLKAPVEERDGDGTRRMTGGKGSSCGTPQGGVVTPPTILQSSFAVWPKRPRVGGGRSDPEDDIDAVAVDLDALDQGPDQVGLERPVDLGHPSPNPLCEVLEPADEQRQGRPQDGLVPQGRGPLLPARDPLPQAGDARLELGLVDQAGGIAVDEPRRGAAQLRDLGLDLAELRTAAPAPPRLVEAPPVLGRDAGRVPQ